MKTSPDVRSAICVADLQVRLSLAVRVVLGVLVQPLRDHEAVQRQESAPDLPGECLQAITMSSRGLLDNIWSTTNLPIVDGGGRRDT